MIKDKVIVSDDIVDHTMCDLLVHEITSISAWQIGTEHYSNEIFSGNYGHILRSYYKNEINFSDERFYKINSLTQYIVYSCINNNLLQEPYTNIDIKRIFWNHYNQGGFVPDHVDCYEDVDFIQDGSTPYSILVHLTDSGGGNVVSGETIDNNKGRVIIFDSRITHKSLPSENNHRYTLNVLITAK